MVFAPARSAVASSFPSQILDRAADVSDVSSADALSKGSEGAAEQATKIIGATRNIGSE
jgi:hypothetical protein